MNRLFLFLLLIQYLHAQDCSKYYDDQYQEFYLPRGQTCKINQTNLFFKEKVLESFIVNGNLLIEDDVSFHLKFQTMIIGSEGSILIGQEKPIQNNLIILEDVSNQVECEPTDLQGKILIRSSPFNQYELNATGQKGSVEVSLKQVEDNLLDQKIVFVPFQESQLRQYQITSVIGNKIILDTPLVDDLLVLHTESLFHNKIIGFIIKRTFGVELRRMCISAKTLDLQGTTILQPQGIHAKVTNSIKNCLFYKLHQKIRQDSNYHQIIINLQDTEFTDNILFEGREGKGIKFELKETKDLTNNFFGNIKFNQISIQFLSQKNTFKNCDLGIQPEEIDQTLFFKGISFSQVQLNFFKGNQILDPVNLVIQDNSYFYDVKPLTLHRQIISLEISDSLFIKTLLIEGYDQTIYSILIRDCLVYGDNQIDNFLTLPKKIQRSRKDYIEIIIIRSQFAGFLGSIIDSKASHEDGWQGGIAQNLNDLLYDVRWKSSYFTPGQMQDESQFFFNLDNIFITNISEQDKESYFIETNQKYQKQSLNKIDLNLIAGKSSGNLIFESNHPASFLQISFREEREHFLNVFENGKDDLLKSSEQPIVIFDGVPQYIKLVAYSISNSMKKLSDISQLLLVLSSSLPLKETGKNKQLFLVSERTIKNVKLIHMSYSKECMLESIDSNDIQTVCEIIRKEEIGRDKMKISNSLPFIYIDDQSNSIVFEWWKIKNNIAMYYLDIEYCNEGEKYQIESYHQKEGCVSKCNFDYDQIHSCQQTINQADLRSECELGCDKCEITTKSCKVCRKGLFLWNEVCVSECPSGFFRSEQGCSKCSFDCVECISSEVCLKCHENTLSSGKCISCDLDVNRGISECAECEQFGCQICIGDGKFQCAKCKPNFKFINGICQQLLY